MNDLTISIADLKSKIEKLIELHQQLKKNNELLSNTNQNLEQIIGEQKITIELLQKNKEELIQSKNEEQNRIVADTKLKINELVQEIDNCITLLK
jgi:hypothetical protein